MGDAFRVLVTGSREWIDRWILGWALEGMQALATARGARLVIVHGDNRRGADALAQEWADLKGVETERYPADWKGNGKAAGPIRNGVMVNTGPDLCLAFPLGTSSGTRDCIARAQSARIPTVVFDPLP